jgi:hypothetical protein
MNLNVKSRVKLLVILAAAVIGLLAFDRLVLTPLAGAWKERSNQIAQRKKEVSAGRLLLERERPIRERWESIQRGALPPARSAAEEEVYRAVERWAQASRISITSMRPQWRQNEDYVTVDWRTDAFGDLNAVTRFLYELENDPMALRLEEVEITARDNQGRQLALALRFSGLTLAASNQR